MSEQSFEELKESVGCESCTESEEVIVEGVHKESRVLFCAGCRKIKYRPMG